MSFNPLYSSAHINFFYYISCRKYTERFELSHEWMKFKDDYYRSTSIQFYIRPVDTLGLECYQFALSAAKILNFSLNFIYFAHWELLQNFTGHTASNKTDTQARLKTCPSFVNKTFFLLNISNILFTEKIVFRVRKCLSKSGKDETS